MNNEWISVDERLPDTNRYTNVLVTVLYDYAVDVGRFSVYVGEYDGYSKSFEWWRSGGRWSEDDIHHVTHWMPLPEPPKEAV